VNLLLVGSPNCQELRGLKNKEKYNIVSVDLVEVKTDSELIKEFKSYRHIEGSYKDIDLTNKYDIILSRWFIHHLNAQEKEEYFKQSYNLLKFGGKLITVDYFLQENSTDEREQYVEYIDYQIKLKPFMNKKNAMICFDERDLPNHKGGKMESLRKTVSKLEAAEFKNGKILQVPTIKGVDEKKFGQHILVARKVEK